MENNTINQLKQELLVFIQTELSDCGVYSQVIKDKLDFSTKGEIKVFSKHLDTFSILLNDKKIKIHDDYKGKKEIGYLRNLKNISVDDNQQSFINSLLSKRRFHELINKI